MRTLKTWRDTKLLIFTLYMDFGYITLNVLIDYYGRKKMEELKIVALVEFNSGVAVVFNREPSYTYQIDGNLLYAVDGPFISCFGYDRPSKAFQAFGGRKFTLPMKDGTVTECCGQWWDKGQNELSERLGYEVGHLTKGTFEDLKRCYVFSGTSCNKTVMDKMISEYKGCTYPYWDYEKIIKFEDVQMRATKTRLKLERDKENLIEQCKRLKGLINAS